MGKTKEEFTRMREEQCVSSFESNDCMKVMQNFIEVKERYEYGDISSMEFVSRCMDLADEAENYGLKDWES